MQWKIIGIPSFCIYSSVDAVTQIMQQFPAHNLQVRAVEVRATQTLVSALCQLVASPLLLVARTRLHLLCPQDTHTTDHDRMTHPGISITPPPPFFPKPTVRDLTCMNPFSVALLKEHHKLFHGSPQATSFPRVHHKPLAFPGFITKMVSLHQSDILSSLLHVGDFPLSDRTT